MAGLIASNHQRDFVWGYNDASIPVVFSPALAQVEVWSAIREDHFKVFRTGANTQHLTKVRCE